MIGIGGYFEWVCREKKGGKVLWTAHTKNMYVQEGLTYIVNTLFKAGTRADPLYLGLFKTESPAAGWTMANNGSTWHEDAAYDEATREEFVDGSITGTTTRQLNNNASKAEFTMNASGVAKGAFLATNSTKGGTTGDLLCASAFAEGDQTYTTGNIISVKYTVGIQDA